MAAHRYWRVFLNSCAYGNAYGLAEVEFRTTAGVALPFSGGTASASTVYSAPTYSAVNAADGNASTFWASANEVTSFWAYDLGVGNSRDVVEIMLTTRPDSFWNQGPTSFTPEWSDDGVSWTPMHTLTATWASAGQTQVFPVTVATPGMALTTLTVEEWGIGSPSVQMTAIAVEQWGIGNAPALATQVAVEQWADGNPRAQVTQVALEQWSSVANLTPTIFSARFV
jgi:hypothetical protein